LVDALDQPLPRVTCGREHQVVLKNVVEIDEPAVTVLEHRDPPAMVLARPKLRDERIVA